MLVGNRLLIDSSLALFSLAACVDRGCSFRDEFIQLEMNMKQKNLTECEIALKLPSSVLRSITEKKNKHGNK